MDERKEKFDYLVQQFILEKINGLEVSELLAYLKEASFAERFDDLARSHAISHRNNLLKMKDANYASQIAPQIKKKAVLKRTKLYWAWGIAAMITIVIGTVSLSIYQSTLFVQEQIQTYIAKASEGSQTNVTLPDGTWVRLNSGSTLCYNTNYGKSTRTVQLSGEGYFKVTSSPDKPFIVEANKIKTQVFGTVFNIRNYDNDDEIWVDLIEGKVSVTNMDNKENGKALVLTPNRRAIYNKEKQTLNVIETDTGNASSWMNGKYYFVNTSFIDIAKYLERQYDVNITINSTDLQKEYYTGSINLKQSLETVFNLLDVDQVYVLLRSGKEITIKRKIDLEPV